MSLRDDEIPTLQCAPRDLGTVVAATRVIEYHLAMTVRGDGAYIVTHYDRRSYVRQMILRRDLSLEGLWDGLLVPIFLRLMKLN